MIIWKPIPGWEDYYEVSDEGNVKSLERIVTFGKGGEKLKKESILKARINSNGYPAINLCKNGKCKQIENHRLVALTFIDNPHNKPSVNHINGIKTDNRVENLEWATWSEQQRHARAMGLVVFTDKQREIFENANRNKVISDETKRKMSISNMGKTPWNKGLTRLEMQKYKKSWGV